MASCCQARRKPLPAPPVPLDEEPPIRYPSPTVRSQCDHDWRVDPTIVLTSNPLRQRIVCTKCFAVGSHAAFKDVPSRQSEVRYCHRLRAEMDRLGLDTLDICERFDVSQSRVVRS